MPFGMKVGLGQGDFVLDGAQLSPNFGPISIVAKWSPVLATAEFLYLIVPGCIVVDILIYVTRYWFTCASLAMLALVSWHKGTGATPVPQESGSGLRMVEASGRFSMVGVSALTVCSGSLIACELLCSSVVSCCYVFT